MSEREQPGKHTLDYGPTTVVVNGGLHRGYPQEIQDGQIVSFGPPLPVRPSSPEAKPPGRHRRDE
ncbi:MAG: hypothetical protein ACREHC_03105 [Candidatus Levyibacteriota bacterium]